MQIMASIPARRSCKVTPEWSWGLKRLGRLLNGWWPSLRGSAARQSWGGAEPANGGPPTLPTPKGVPLSHTSWYLMVHSNDTTAETIHIFEKARRIPKDSTRTSPWILPNHYETTLVVNLKLDVHISQKQWFRPSLPTFCHEQIGKHERKMKTNLKTEEHCLFFTLSIYTRTQRRVENLS